jgi:elongation factor 1-beta
MPANLEGTTNENSAMQPGKPKPAAKSMVTLDIKPWDDTTVMRDLESAVRGIEADGLVWGTSSLMPIGYGVEKLRINLVVEDQKVSVTELQEQIEDLEEFVQSSDVVAMQKI